MFHASRCEQSSVIDSEPSASCRGALVHTHLGEKVRISAATRFAVVSAAGEATQVAVQPPSTWMICPVTKLDASLAKNSMAPSSSPISPVRPIGVLSVM